MRPEEIQQYCEELFVDAIEELGSLGYVIETQEARASHLFGINLPENIEMDRVKKALSVHKINISIRGNVLRISPNVYNDQKDVQRLLRALKEAII